MHPLSDSIDQFLDDCHLYGFGKPAIMFPTWEDGAVLMIRSGLMLDAATPISMQSGEDDVLGVVINKTLIMFPTRDASKSVSGEIARRVNGVR
jgi:hypothetical protein